MKIAVRVILFVLLLSHIDLKTHPVNVPSKRLGQESYELIQYGKKVIKVSKAFGDKYSNKPRFKCVACKKGTLTHGDLIGLIFLESTGALVHGDTLSPSRKFIDEALKIFPKKSLNELMDFMLCAANDLKIKCDTCSGNQWIAID